MISLGLGVGWSVWLGVGVSVETTLHPAPSPVFKGLLEDFYALGAGVDKVSSYSIFFEG
jgi:hypothetical protein